MSLWSKLVWVWNILTSHLFSMDTGSAVLRSAAFVFSVNNWKLQDRPLGQIWTHTFTSLLVCDDNTTRLCVIPFCVMDTLTLESSDFSSVCLHVHVCVLCILFMLFTVLFWGWKHCGIHLPPEPHTHTHTLLYVTVEPLSNLRRC